MTREQRPLSFLLGVGVLVLLAGFLWGVATVQKEVFPFSLLERFQTSVEKTQGIGDTHFLHPVRHDESGVTVRNADAMAPGVTLLSSYWERDGDMRPALRLVDARGRLLHEWPIRPTEIWPESPHDDDLKGSGNYPTNYALGTYLFPDGDVVFNIEYLGLVRMDACGEVVWKLPYRTHHAVHRAHDGNFWVIGHRRIESEEENDVLPGLDPPFGEDMLLEVSPGGEILRKIGVLSVLADSDYQYLLAKHRLFSRDVTHANDVEVLSPEMAEAYPSFEAGDILFSLRKVDSIFVIDAETREVKFHHSGRLLAQHDPDFLKSGWISVFNNRNCRRQGNCEEWRKHHGGSEILAVDPSTGETRRRLGRQKGPEFYTKTVGSHQQLANGHLLVVETRAGRVFEATSEGEIVWEWIHAPVGDSVPEVLGALRYDYGLDRIESWSCGSG